MAQQPGAGESGSGPRRWRIEPVRKDGDAVENYKVVFMHNGNAYELGLFSTREEGTRVADVLTIKEAVDAGEDLNNLRLEYPLDRYGVDNTTAHEIRSVSFNQVVRDLQCCCVEQLVPEGTVPGWTTELPSTHKAQTIYRSVDDREYHERMSQGEGLMAGGSQLDEQHEEDEGGEDGAAQHDAAVPPRGGLQPLPPRPATSSKSQQAPSAAGNLFDAAGKANAAAGVSGDMRPPLPRPPAALRGAAPMLAVPSGPSGISGAAYDDMPEALAAGAAAAAALQAPPVANGTLAEAGAEPGGFVLQVPHQLQPRRAAFRGITQTGRKWRCQTHLSGRNVGMVAGTTQAEAALVYDLIMIWKNFHTGDDPAIADLNFHYHDIAKDSALLSMLRDECPTSESATQLLGALVQQGAIARVFGVQMPAIGRLPKAPKPPKPPKSGGGAKKMHWRTRERLDREHRQQRGGAQLDVGGYGDEDDLEGEEDEEEDEEEEGYDDDEYDGTGERPRKKKKMHWRTAARLERERGLLAAAEGATATAGPPAMGGDAGTGPPSGKKMHWKTAAKLERERQSRLQQEQAGVEAGGASPRQHWRNKEGAQGGAPSLAAATGAARYSGVSPAAKGNGWRAQVNMRTDELGRVVPGGHVIKNFSMPVFASQEEAAAAHDLACMWRDMQVGKDPQARQYHFPYRTYHANQQVMNALRACDELSELYAWLKQLGADGGLAAHVEQASGKAPGAQAAAAPSRAQQQQAAPPASQAMHPVLAHRWDNHPFHGITATTQRDKETGEPLMHAQFTVKVDGSGRVSQMGSERRSVHLCACKSAAEAAAAFDVAHIWRQLQIGIDPAVAEEDPTPRYRYNFGYLRYGNDAQLMQQIRGTRDIQQLQSLVKELNRQGILRQLATGSYTPTAQLPRKQQQQPAGASPSNAAHAGVAGEEALPGLKRPAPAIAAEVAMPLQKQARVAPAQQELRQDAAATVAAPAAAIAAVHVPAIPIPPGQGPYEAREEGRTQALERMCNDVKRMLAEVPAITHMQRVQFLAYYTSMRSLWRFNHQELKGMYDDRRYEDIALYVHAALTTMGIMAAQAQHAA